MSREWLSFVGEDGLCPVCGKGKMDKEDSGECDVCGFYNDIVFCTMVNGDEDADGGANCWSVNEHRRRYEEKTGEKAYGTYPNFGVNGVLL